MVHQTHVEEAPKPTKPTRHVVTKPIVPTSVNRPADQSAAQSARPTTSNKDKDAAATQQVNQSINPAITYAYQLGYSVNSAHLIARLILHRGDEPVVKEAAKKKPANALSINQSSNQPVESRDESIDLAINIAPDANLMINVYPYEQWINQPDIKTITFDNRHQIISLPSIDQSIDHPIDQLNINLDKALENNSTDASVEPTISIDQSAEQLSEQQLVQTDPSPDPSSQLPDNSPRQSIEQSLTRSNGESAGQPINQSINQMSDQAVDNSILQPMAHLQSNGECVLKSLPLTKSSPLMIEILLDPSHHSDLIKAFETSQIAARRVVSAAPAMPLQSPSAKKKAGKTTIEEPVIDDITLPVTCSIVSRVAAPVIAAVDITIDDIRREMKLSWEKAEPGRARKARMAREKFIEASKNEQQLPDHPSFIIARIANFHPINNDERAALTDQSKQLRARGEQYNRVVQSIRSKAIQCAEASATQASEQYSVELKALQAADAAEINERESIRQMQLREDAQMKAVTDLLALRVAEVQAAKLKATAPVVIDKKAKVDKKKVVDEPEQMTRAQFLVKVDGVLEPLLAVQASRQWRVRSTIDTARQIQRDEVKEEADQAIETLNETLVKAAEWRDQQAAIAAAAAAPAPMLSPTTARKDKSKAPSKANDAKAEKERQERERKQAEEWMVRERAEQEDKLNVWAALDVAIQMATSLRALHAQHPENEVVIEQVTNKRDVSIFNELKMLLRKIKRDENDEAEKEIASQAGLSPRPASPSVKGSAKTLPPASPHLAPAILDSSRPTTPLIDLASFIQTNYPSPSPLQLHAAFLHNVKKLADEIKQLPANANESDSTVSVNDDQVQQEVSAAAQSDVQLAVESVEPSSEASETSTVSDVAPAEHMSKLSIAPLDNQSNSQTTDSSSPSQPIMQITAPVDFVIEQPNDDESLSSADPDQQLAELLIRSGSVLDALQSKWEADVRTRARKDDKKPKAKGK